MLPFKSPSEILHVSYFNRSQNVTSTPNSAPELPQNSSHTILFIIPVICRNPTAQPMSPRWVRLVGTGCIGLLPLGAQCLPGGELTFSAPVTSGEGNDKLFQWLTGMQNQPEKQQEFSYWGVRWPVMCDVLLLYEEKHKSTASPWKKWINNEWSHSSL